MALRNQYYEWTDELTNFGWFVALMGSIWTPTRFDVYNGVEGMALLIGGALIGSVIAIWATGSGDTTMATLLAYGTGFVAVGALTIPLENEYLFLPVAVATIFYATVMSTSTAFYYRSTGWTAGGLVLGLFFGFAVVV